MPICHWCQFDSDDADTCVWCKRPIRGKPVYYAPLMQPDVDDRQAPAYGMFFVIAAAAFALAGAAYLLIPAATKPMEKGKLPVASAPKGLKDSARFWADEATNELKEEDQTTVVSRLEVPEATWGTNRPIESSIRQPGQSQPPQTVAASSTSVTGSDNMGGENYVETADFAFRPSEKGATVEGTIHLVNTGDWPIESLAFGLATESTFVRLKILGAARAASRAVTRFQVVTEGVNPEIIKAKDRQLKYVGMANGIRITGAANLNDLTNQLAQR